MLTYVYGLTHNFRHVNKEKRAGLTGCGKYVDLEREKLGDTPVTCIECLGYVPPRCICSVIGAAQIPDDELIAGHDSQCSAVEGFDAVEERIEDVVRECVRRGEHNMECDNDGFCQACGYQYTFVSSETT